MTGRDCKDCRNCQRVRGFMCICKYKGIEIGQDLEHYIYTAYNRNHAVKCALYEEREVKEVQTEFCEDAISRQAAIEEVRRYIMTSGVKNQGTWNECVDCITHSLQGLPSVTAERKGKWISCFDDWGSHVKTLKGYKCSNCNGEHTDTETGVWHETHECKYPYCPNCGAKMEVE